MSLLNPFKLEKLQIHVYKKTGKEEEKNIKYTYSETLEVMFNPTSFSRRFSNAFQIEKEIGGTNREITNSEQNPEQISLELMVDSTGVTDFGLESILGIGSDSVSKQIEDLRTRCLDSDLDSHDVNYLILEWGDLYNFGCHMTSMDVTYTLFDKSGAPLRAKINVVFLQSIDPHELKLRRQLHSADITRVKVVAMGDTLPQLTKDVYGSYDDLFMLARANDLDQFRKLTPGMSLVFPSKSPNA